MYDYKFDKRPLAEQMDDEIPWARFDRDQAQLEAMGYEGWQDYLQDHEPPTRHNLYRKFNG